MEAWSEAEAESNSDTDPRLGLARNIFNDDGQRLMTAKQFATHIVTLRRQRLARRKEGMIQMDESAFKAHMV